MKDTTQIYDGVSVNYAAETAAHVTVVDLTDKNWEGAVLNASIVTQATAPISGRTVVVYYAFSNDEIDPGDVPSELVPARKAFSMVLSGNAGVTRRYVTGVVPVTGDYLYTWVSHGSLGGVGASVLLSLDISRMDVAVEQSGTCSHVSASAVVTPATLAANPVRRGLTIFNDSDQDMYVAYGDTVNTSTNFAVKLVRNAYWEMPQPIWTGELTYAWGGTATGTAQIIEFS